jgi:hypothetical protein
MSVQSSPQVPQPLPEEIATAAYCYWLKEGCVHGRDVEQWL